MTDVSNGATFLRLDTGTEVRALVQVRSGGGNRQRCLFLHGNPGSLMDWSRIFPRLSERFDIAAIDMPGFGQSPRPDSTPGCLSLDRLADHAIGAADALSWREPFFLVGHSHGGGVAQVASARYPDRIAGIVLLGTLGAPAHLSYRLLSLPGASALAGVGGRLLRQTSLHSVSREVVRGVMRGIFSPEPVPAERADRELAQLSARPEILSSMVHVTRGRPSDQLLRSAARIRCPALFLHGEDDALVPPRFARSIHERIVSGGGRSTFRLVPGAGHMLVEYQAAEVATWIADFISQYVRLT